MASIETAIRELRQVLNADQDAPGWRWLVRQKLSVVNDALTDAQVRSWDAWLAARARTSNRNRRQLLARVGVLGVGVLDKFDVDRVRHEVERLVGDLEHYAQRAHDLVYDSVSLEIGGSE